MRCKKCGFTWKIGNIDPKFSSCPVCNIDFGQNIHFREYSNITELIQVLLAENENILDNPFAVNGYIADYFPDNKPKRELIKCLIEENVFGKFEKWKSVKLPENDIHKFISDFFSKKREEDFLGGIPEEKVVETILYLLKLKKEPGSDLIKPDIYIAHAEKQSNNVLKIVFLKKALSLKKSEELAFQIIELEKSMGYIDAIRDLEILSNSGSTKAVLQLAKAYEKGIHIKRDFYKAFCTLKNAEYLLDDEIFFQIGRYFILGWGVEKNIVLAGEYFQRASDLCNPKAKFQLYGMHYNGMIGEVDFKKAINYLKEASNLGYPPAQYEYAMYLYYGDGIKKNKCEAMDLLNKAAESGYEEAMDKVNYLNSKLR